MAEVAFYHLMRTGAAEALPALLQKTLAADKKALVCCEAGRTGPLSTAIWSQMPDSWLPHGVRGRDDDDSDAAICPIWITDDAADNPAGAGFYFFMDGITPQTPEAAERIFVIFDGRDGEAVTRAREQWKALKDGGGHSLRYMQQDEQGGWQEKA